MRKEKIIEEIKKVIPIEGHNSMGASESYYNPYFMVNKCFTEEELKTMNEDCLNHLIKLATFAGDIFY